LEVLRLIKYQKSIVMQLLKFLNLTIKEDEK
jgi:hypothetical protein